MHTPRLKLHADPVDKGVLVDEKTGEVINVGDERQTANGEKCIVLGWRKKQAPSTGRVAVSFIGKHQTEYYPSVIGAKIV